MSQQTKTYEGMFLLGAGGGDFEAASEPIRNILARNQAEVLLLKAWDERKLAYDISSHRKGLYALSFFSVDPARVAEIEHDCRLDERIVRVLILRRDRLTKEEIEAERTSTARPSGPREGDSRPGEGDRGYGRRRGTDRQEERAAEAGLPAGEPEQSEQEPGEQVDKEG